MMPVEPSFSNCPANFSGCEWGLMNLKMLSANLRTMVDTLSTLVRESADPRLCKSMHRQGSRGSKLSLRSYSVAECLLMFKIIEMILF